MAKKKTVTVYAEISVSLSKELGERAAQRDVSRSHEVRRAIREMLERERGLTPART